jgi:two-component system, cell cycle sensor histidine kinase and response regulator CckA
MATVRLVDDESAITSLYQITLTRHGHHVLTADNGTNAVRIGLNPNAPIDVLITDWQMPGFTGDVLAHRLLSALPNLAVIFMSGYDDAEQIATRIDSARVMFLRKPFSPKLLQEKIRVLLISPPDEVANSLPT